MDFALWSIFAALLTRLLYAGHSFIAVWRLTDQTDDTRYWALTFLLLLLLFETFYIVIKRKGREWKWSENEKAANKINSSLMAAIIRRFSPSVLFYLMCTVPAIWFLELDRIDVYKEGLEDNMNRTNSTSCVEQDAEVALSDIAGLRIPLKLTSDAWLACIEQMLVFILVIGRWLMPNREMSHDELSMLLFVYLGMGSDIMELLVLFEEDYVVQDDIVIYAILGVWSASLLQFTLALTATRSGRRAYTTIGDDRLEENDPATEQNFLCCANEIWSIFTTIILQDGPFLALRLYVILENETLTYAILFFTLKNILVLLVQIYRLCVVCCCSTGPTALQAGIRTSVQQQLLQQPVSLQRKNSRKEKPPKVKKEKKSKKGKTPKSKKSKKAKNLENGNIPTDISQTVPTPENIPILDTTAMANGSPIPDQTLMTNLIPNESPPSMNPVPIANQLSSPGSQNFGNQYAPQIQTSQMRPGLQYNTPLPTVPMNTQTTAGSPNYANYYTGGVATVGNQMGSDLPNYSFPTQTTAINTSANVNPRLTSYPNYGYQF